MEKSNLVVALQEIVRTYTDQIREMEADRQAANRMIRRLSRDGQLEIPTVSSVAKVNTMGPTLAIRELLSQFPNKWWQPTETRDKLDLMRQSGELASETKDLLTTVHSVFKRLHESGYAEKKGSGRKIKYRKKPD